MVPGGSLSFFSLAIAKCSEFFLNSMRFEGGAVSSGISNGENDALPRQFAVITKS
jgi:hypothetical protein